MIKVKHYNLTFLDIDVLTDILKNTEINKVLLKVRKAKDYLPDILKELIHLQD